MRIKGGPRGHRKKVKLLGLAKGYRGARSKLIKKANEAVVRSGEHAFAGRKIRRRDFRRLWISRINAALRQEDIMYSRFIAALKKGQVTLDRKTLAELAYSDLEAFQAVVKSVKSYL
ncbi:TPA: 50S ribosomal protein L20 [candidate division WWE3 bacterium]|uniref:Large ribosomal subunit protein bL20 n=5 Tax=Katanobacteria TaxID=422282 RepID=A0A0G1KMN1_UNCKA|nr:MAG: 50S ribosomal protein L20 [candidate division WWE3 bacterium GW2011_GWA2_44_16]KKT69632.1 MAG: 50S ribosomal protein L20 [candidate division WWE3 bacterium GW2011_GWB1_44_4]KKT84951.1 MAG: 50S ribosomal protein L20 [candidate division WWE3 bacterium GW2011_GWC2_44_9]OGC51424.1 MAG: 50S ribosomal protein L20 [candidate division WWE3 bacterium RIFCSPHIGHO2_01_FULL_43_9]HAZ29734.1 50S ribosomal protein L20 [candidate division WWE3 bacterium]